MPSKHDIDKKRLLSRRTFSAKSFAAQTDWLEAPFYDGAQHLQYGEAHSRHDVNADLLARTQRQLYKLRQDREAAEKALGDSHAWLERRQRLLDEVKILHALKQQQQVTDPAAQPELSQMLNQVVIAAVVNSAGGNIGSAIADRGSQACPALLALIVDPALPMLSRSFAAMILGTIHGGVRMDRLPAAARAAELLPAYKFGAAHGVDERSTLYNRLLTAKDGTQLAQRARAAWHAARWSAATDRKAIEWLVSGASAAQLVQFLENLSKVELMRRRLKTLSPNLKMWKQRQAAKYVEESQIELTKAMQRCVDIAMDGRDADLVISTCDLFEKFYQVLHGARLGQKEWDRLLFTLSHVLALPNVVAQPFRADCLRLVERTARRMETPANHPKKQGLSLLNTISPNVDHDYAPIILLLEWTQDAALVGRAVDLQIVGGLADHQRDRIDADTLAMVLQVVSVLRTNACYPVLSILNAVRACRGNQRSRTELQQLVAMLKDCKEPGMMFRHLMDSIYSFPKMSIRQGIQIYAETLNGSKNWNVELAQHVGTFCLLARSCHGDAAGKLMDEVVDRLLSAHAGEHWDAVTTALYIALYLCEGDEKLFRQLYDCSYAKRVTVDVTDELLSLRPLLALPRVRDNFRRAFIHHPGSCMNMIAQARLAAKLQLSLELICKPLERDSSDIECICEQCRRTSTLTAEAHVHWLGYVHAQRCIGSTHELPQSVIKWLDMPENLSKELMYLEKKHPPSGRPPNIEQRITRLRFYRQFPRTMEAEINLHARRELEKTESFAFLHATEELIKRAIENNSSREQLELLGLTRDQLLDLIVLRTTLNKSQNRGELKRLLSACAKGDLHWPHRQPANRQFLKAMRETGMDADVWVEGFPAYVTAPEIDAKALRISVEQNPIEVLKMGVYFDTCLSLDGVNAFSSIANATDLNKRVIYVRNAEGEPLARKLLAISDDWELLGYLVYLADRLKPQQVKIVVGAINQYALELASRVGIKLSSSGTVSTLVSKSWYDDGTVAWPGDEDMRALRTLCFGEKPMRPNQ